MPLSSRPCPLIAVADLDFAAFKARVEAASDGPRVAAKRLEYSSLFVEI